MKKVIGQFLNLREMFALRGESQLWRLQIANADTLVLPCKQTILYFQSIWVSSYFIFLSHAVHLQDLLANGRSCGSQGSFRAIEFLRFAAN